MTIIYKIFVLNFANKKKVYINFEFLFENVYFYIK